MPDEARVRTSIWRDKEFLALPRDVQGTYVFLFTQADISTCGLLVMRLALWASKAEGLTEQDLRRQLDLLAETRFVVIDDETQELLVRSRIRRDDVLAGPKMIRPLIAACEEVESIRLRTVIAEELRRCLFEGTVNPSIINKVERLVINLGRFAQTSLFSQVDTLSDTLPDTLADTLADTPRGRGRGRGKGFGGGVGGEMLPFGSGDRPALAHGAKPKYELGSDADPDFAEFWRVYPRKTAKGAGREAWAKAVRGGAAPAEIIAAAAAFAAIPREPKFTPHPATWLNQERYHDDPATAGGRTVNGREPGWKTALRSIERGQDQPGTITPD